MNYFDLRYETISRIRCYEQLFFPLMATNKKLRHIEGVPLVDPDTELVIEGYLRCANTFAALAFVQAQETPVKIANHTHAPASVERAVRLGIPTLVLIRNPKDVAISHVLKYPGLSLAQSLKWYRLFYERVWPHRDWIVLADFEEVTSDFGRVINKVNDRFLTKFTLFEHSDANVEAVLGRIQRADAQLNPNDPGRISIPIASKNKLKRTLSEKLSEPSLKPWLDNASEVYKRFSRLDFAVG